MRSPATPTREPGFRVPTFEETYDRYYRAFDGAFEQLDELRAHVEAHDLDPRTEPPARR